MDKIDEIMARWFIKTYEAHGTSDAVGAFMARALRKTLTDAGFVIVPATSDLLRRGNDAVEGGKVR